MKKFIEIQKIDNYIVNIDYRKTLEQAVKAGNYDYGSDYIDSKNFSNSEAKQGVESTQQKSKVTTQIALIQIPSPSGRSSITTEEAKDALNNLGYRLANLYELLALGAQHQELQRQFWIVGLGSSWVDPGGGRYVPCLGRGGSGRGLGLGWANAWWVGGWRFAAVNLFKFKADAEFIGFQEDGIEKIPLFNVTRPFHKKFGSTVTLETLMRFNLSYPPWAKDYHEHDFIYDVSSADDIKLCVCNEQEEYDSKKE